MVRDAQDHADDDRRRREEVETRNQAEQLTYQAERTLKDLGDKVSPDDRAATERSVETVREALKGSDLDAVQKATTELAEVLQRVGTAAYQASASAAGGPDDGASDNGQAASGDGTGPAEPEADGEETVEGEFKEV